MDEEYEDLLAKRLPHRVCHRAGDVIESVLWCNERMGPGALYLTDAGAGRERYLNPDALWGRLPGGIYFFADADTAFEFRMRWG